MPRTLTTLFSGRNVRLESLNGSLMRTTSCTPSNSSNSRGSMVSTGPITPRMVCSEPEERWTSKPRRTSSAVTRSMLVSSVCFCMTMTMGSPLDGLKPVLHVARFALHAARLVDDSFKKTPHSGGIERALGRALDVQQHVLFPLRRVDRQSEDAFELADLDCVLGALIEQANDDFVHAIDGLAQAVQVVLGVNGVHNKKPFLRREKGSYARQPCALARGGAQMFAPRYIK